MPLTRSRRSCLRLLAAAFFLFLTCCQRPPAPPAAADFDVMFFDVGQGDAALLRTPENHTVVIDTGRGAETAALLRREGVSRIDLLIVSHPHADHDGGLAAVLQSFPVEETWYAGRYRGKNRKLLAGTRARGVSAGTRAQLGQLSLTVLHPEPDGVTRGHEPDVNNGSVVVKASYGPHHYLFPGDCELGCWEQLFKLHRSELRAQVLKAAHHGSWNGTNSGVLINVRPRNFIISCGEGNRYGHPHKTVLMLVDKLGAKLLRTDRQGDIRCEGARCAPMRPSP